jgi:nucleoside-diphosphate-sugar epimerase
VHILCVNVWINGIVAQPCEPGINRNIEIRIDGESLEPSIPDGIDVVFHEAAYGGYMPEISKYVAVNSFGTAQLLEIIREKNLGVRKIVVASSQVVYPEGRENAPNTAWSFLG